MNARTLARSVARFLREHGRPIAVYVGPDGAIGYSEVTTAREMMPMKLAGTYDANSDEGLIAADLQAAGMQ